MVPASSYHSLIQLPGASLQWDSEGSGLPTSVQWSESALGSGAGPASFQNKAKNRHFSVLHSAVPQEKINCCNTPAPIKRAIRAVLSWRHPQLPVCTSRAAGRWGDRGWGKVWHRANRGQQRGGREEVEEWNEPIKAKQTEVKVQANYMKRWGVHWTQNML